MSQRALLALADGTLFTGISLGASGQTSGEIIFNTAHSGYQEILSDPSYHSQLITFTFPHIGNTGTNPDDMESAAPSCAGLVVRNASAISSNWRNDCDLHQFLCRHSVVGIAGVDTRELTAHIRREGAMTASILSGAEAEGEDAAARAVQLACDTPAMTGQALAPAVSTTADYDWCEGVWSLPPSQEQEKQPDSSDKPRIAVYDYGCKRNILRLLSDRGAEVRVYPYATAAAEVLAWKPHGVFLSNGPGDPAACSEAVATAKTLSDPSNLGLPLLGICLGHQILSLALGAHTEKMKFGHHGANHPVLEIATGRVFVSSQNHGFTVSATDLPAHLEITHKSLFDGSVQGFHHKQLPISGFQGHPEASPGPQELDLLFDRFVAQAEQYRKETG